jgi:hypothetical protein
MDAAAIITDLQADGVHLSADGDRLLARPKHALTDAHRHLVRAHRAELLAHLQAANHPPPSPADEAAIRHWLDHIGETDERIVAEVLQMCAENPDALAYYLMRAREVPDQPLEQTR